jgi:dCMP deaminase
MHVGINWDDLWIKAAALIAKRSKDPRTKVGVIIVSPDNRRISVGYNGFPYGIKETEERWKRPTKYSFVCHAEINAIIQANANLEGWTLYTTIPVCSNCAKYVIQAGINRVIYKDEPKKGSKLDYKHASTLLREAGIRVTRWGGKR